jgi:hypothetical protein
MTHPSALRLHDYLDSSSLDPLVTLIGDDNVGRQPLAPFSPTGLPPSSPPKGMRLVEDFSLSSPHRANRRKSQAPNSPTRKVACQSLSPWKIRVTVEAEPEEVGRTTTRTMKVPLKEHSPRTESVKARERRSQAGSSGAKRRSTPVRGARSGSRARRQSVTDLNITVLGDEEDRNEWSPQKSKKRGRPRNKKRQEEQERHAGLDDEPGSPVHGVPDKEDDGNVAEDPDFQIRPDSDVEGHAQEELGEIENDSPELRKIDLNTVSVRTRSRPPKPHKSHHPEDTSNISPQATRPPALVLETRAADPRATTSAYPTPTSSVQDDFDDIRDVPGDPTGHHEGFDTILESEGFTMIDLDSIPSARHFISPPREQDRQTTRPGTTPADKPTNGNSPSSPAPSVSLPPISSLGGQSQSKPRPTAIPSYLTVPEGESELSSTIPSSPPALAQTIPVPPPNSLHPQTRRTPLPYSSPRLPSPRATAGPPRTLATQPQKSNTPKLGRVVRAGIALQGVLSPKASSERSQGESPGGPRGTPKQRLDDLFEGFDSGTRRELRAGLRLGEELAKRQRSSPPAEIEKEATKASSGTQVWRGETTVQHTPITIAANTGNMVEKRTSSTSVAASFEAKRVKSIGHTSLTEPTTPVQFEKAADAAYLDTQAKERQWQLEREAVSRQIQNANASQVIIISSDGIDEDAACVHANEKVSHCAEDDELDCRDPDESCGDIWLAEVEAHHLSQDQTSRASPDLFPISEQVRQWERAREVVNKPRRSQIPSPWKRGEDVDGASTFVSQSDLSGLLWKQPSSGVRFGAGAIQRQRQGKSDAFSGGSQSTPFRPRESGVDATPLRNSTDQGSAAVTNEAAPEEQALGADDPNFDETSLDHEKDNGEEEETRDLPNESAFELEHHNESDSKESGALEEEEEEEEEEDTETHNDSSLPPQSIKIPVNFNDSTLSAPPLTPSFQSSSPPSSRPSTPRSALKGSRPSLGQEDNGTKKVAFSSQSLCVDETGQKSHSRIKSLSPTPPPSTGPGVTDALQPPRPPPTLSKGIAEPELEREPEPNPASKSWLGWLFASSKVASPAPPSPTPPVVAARYTGIVGEDGATGPANSDRGWVATKSSIATVRRNNPKGEKGVPCFLRPPSYPSDPARDVSVPLATSGEFTDVHFRTLHVIYRKSLHRSFHAPDAIRPRLQKLVGEKFTCDEREYGYFAWEVDQDAVIVVERFMMEVELGWDGKGQVEWGWSEKDLCGRLFRIIVGEEVRREQSWRRGQEIEQKKKTAPSVTARV